MITPNRTAELIKPLLAFFIVLFLLHMVYDMIMRDEDDDSFSITITYDCKAVLENRNYYSGQIVDMCEELRRSL
jgi:hypothetical protein